jgi:hypothetical protein
MSTIITKNSANSGSQPSSLIQGELAINVTDGKLFYGSGSGNIVKEFTGSGGGGGTIGTGSFATTGSNIFIGNQTISGSLHQSGTFYPDQIDWFSSSIGYNTGSYILTTTFNGLTTYANYPDVANALAPYIPTVSSSVSASYAQTASYVENAQTASYILQAVSASWAPGGAGTPTFPYTGSAIISGSLEITGSLNINNGTYPIIDTTLSALYGPLGILSIDWGSNQLYDQTPALSIDYYSRKLWGFMTPIEVLDWQNNLLNDASGFQSMDWENRKLNDPTSIVSLDYKNRKLISDDGTTIPLDWTSTTVLTSNTYQRDYKSWATQDVTSKTIGNQDTSYLGDVIGVNGINTFVSPLVTEGMLVYLGTDATWYPVDQTSTNSTKLIGIAHGIFGPPALLSCLILLEGHVVIDDTSSSYPRVAGAGFGLPIYIRENTTIGAMSTTLPTTNIVRLVGHCYQRNTNTSTQWMMKFRPSNDWVEI